MQNYGNWPHVSNNMTASGPSNKRKSSGMAMPGMMQPEMSPDMMNPGMTPHIMAPETMQPGIGPGMMQPGMSPGMMQPGMMQPGMSPDMMKPGMMQPGMCPDMMQPGMMQPGMSPDMMQPGMMQPGTCPDMMQMDMGHGMMHSGMMPGMMGPQKTGTQPSAEMAEALELIKQAIAGETHDKLFYEYLINNATSQTDKDIIKGIRENEINHNKMFRQLYFEHTGTVIKPDENVTFEKPKTYCEGLKEALIGETEAVKKYRRIMAAMKNRKHINMLVEIITDELRHASLYNLLIHNNDCKY